MTIEDQISDMITRIRNSTMVKHENVSVVKSKINENILDLLSNEGFIDSFAESKEEEEKYHYKIDLKYYEEGSSGICGIK